MPVIAPKIHDNGTPKKSLMDSLETVVYLIPACDQSATRTWWWCG